MKNTPSKLSKLSTASLFVAPFLLASCSFPNTSATPTQATVTTESVPDSLGFQAPQGTGLSAADRTTVATAVAVHPTTLTYPSAELSMQDQLNPMKGLFLEDQLNPQPQQIQATAALKALTDQTAYNLLTSYQQNCNYPVIIPASRGGTMPYGGWNFDLLQAGDNITSGNSISVSSSSATAPACPIGFVGSYTSALSVFAIDHTAKSATYNYSLPNANLTVGLAAPFYNAYGVTSVTLNSSASGVSMVQSSDATKNTSSTQMTFNLNGTFAASAIVNFTLQVQSLRKVGPDKSVATETILTTTVYASPATAIITVHNQSDVDAKGNALSPATSDIWLNGQKTTQQDLYNLFGDSMQVMVGNIDLIKNLTIN